MNPVSSPVQPVKEPGRSGFYKGFRNLLTAKPGTLVPILCDPVLAGSRVDLRTAMLVGMPPLASDSFANMRVRVEAFFVPASACYGGFNAAITRRKVQKTAMNSSDASAMVNAIMPGVPVSTGLSTFFDGIFGPGTLSDYLGIKELSQFPSPSGYDNPAQQGPTINPLPFIAYQRIYDRFYRNSLIEQPLFNPPAVGSESAYIGAGQLPYVIIPEDSAQPNNWRAVMNLNYYNSYSWFPVFKRVTNPSGGSSESSTALLDIAKNHSIFSLRQRNYGADYFTNATPTVQKGDPSAIDFTVDTDSGAGSLTIAAIRAANALQIFRERNNMCDDNIHSYNRVHYGVKRSGYGESLPQFLGSGAVNVTVDPISATADFADTQNPFTSVGTQFGRAAGNGELSLIHGFEAPEYGYIMVLASLVPEAQYSSGIRRYLLEGMGPNGYAEIPDPVLQAVGPQAIYQAELYANDFGSVEASDVEAYKDHVFGYQQRYAHYMDNLNEIHGLFRSGNSLAAFALQRKFAGAPTINTDFLKVPTSALDGITAVANEVSEYGYWIDCYHDYKVSAPLAAYSIPTLENPSGHTDFVARPGNRL